MLFANDVILVDKNGEDINLKLKMWRDTLKTKSFRLSEVRAEYMKCNFSNKASKFNGGWMTLRLVEIKVFIT